MGQASSKMRRTTDGFTWWCPACKEIHWLPKSWTFNGNVDRPTFRPSFKHTGGLTVIDEHGEWRGLWWMIDKDGNRVQRKVKQPGDTMVPWCCHYVITAGIVRYQGDCTHKMRDKIVLMPDLPEWLRDP